MSDEIKSAVELGLKSVQEKLDAAITKYEGQVQEAGTASNEAKQAVSALSAEFKAKVAEINASLIDIAQASAKGPAGAEKPKSAAEEFVASAEFKQFADGGKSARARIEVKNTVLADNTTTTWFDQQPGIVPGAFLPLTVYRSLPQYRTGTDTVVLMREASFTNNARGQTEGQEKAQSAITFNKYNVPIETIAHWLKVSKQLIADAPAVVSYIENRLRWGVEAKVDEQLMNGNGTSPQLMGLLDSGNYTVYTPTSGDNLIQAINRAKYQLWAIGYVADTVYVNPADWGAQEIERESAGGGQYLYGAPGTVAGINPFGVRVVITPRIDAGTFLIGQTSVAAGVWNRSGATIEMGYEDNDFTSNLVTVLAEVRLGLGVEVPAAMLGGDWTA
jgi:HK97 family phage major capsid protein